MNTVLEEWHRR